MRPIGIEESHPYNKTSMIFLFYGADDYSHREKITFWKREFEKKHGGDINITTLAGEETSHQEIFQLSSAAPFLGEKRLIIVKNFLAEAKAEDQSALANLLEKIPDFSVVVFSESGEVDKRMALYKKIQKIGKVTEFPFLVGTELLSWIDRMVTNRGGTIERDAALYLSTSVGGDLFRLENEIIKLVSYTKKERPITLRDVELLVDMHVNASIFRLTDGMGQKNKKLALDTLHHLIEMGEDLHRVLYMIMRQFRIITCVKDLASQGLRKEEIASRLKEHPFVVSNTMGQARNFSFQQLSEAYKKLIALDARIKSGGVKITAGDNRELILAMDLLVLQLCGAGNASSDKAGADKS